MTRTKEKSNSHPVPYETLEEAKETHSKNTCYHVTPKKYLEKILNEGLKPKIGERAEFAGEKEKRIYLFEHIDDMENALCNWLGEYYEPDVEELYILKVNTENHTLHRHFFELQVYEPIPPENITILSKEKMP